MEKKSGAPEWRVESFGREMGSVELSERISLALTRLWKSRRGDGKEENCETLKTNEGMETDE